MSPSHDANDQARPQGLRDGHHCSLQLAVATSSCEAARAPGLTTQLCMLLGWRPVSCELQLTLRSQRAACHLTVPQGGADALRRLTREAHPKRTRPRDTRTLRDRHPRLLLRLGCEVNACDCPRPSNSYATWPRFSSYGGGTATGHACLSQTGSARKAPAVISGLTSSGHCRRGRAYVMM